MRTPTDFAGVFIHRDPVDMRRGINGLCELVESEGIGSLSGKSLFVFTGRRRDLIKILYFDRSGFCLWQKRLDRDRFPWPRRHGDKVVALTPAQLSWLLEGYDVWKMKPFEEIKFERVS